MNYLKIIKSSIKKNEYLDRVFRKIYSLFPITIKEKVSSISNVAYSPIEDMNEIIFIHIPKCAGNSIMQTLYGVKGQGHNKLVDYALEDRKKFSTYFKFSVMREPVSRFISAFYYLKSGGMGTYDVEFSNRYLNEYDSVDDLCLAMSADAGLKKTILSWTHFISQFEFLSIDGEVGVDFLICYDYLDQDFDELKKLLGSKCTGKLKSINRNKEKREEEVSEFTIQYLQQIYNADVALYQKLRDRYEKTTTS